MLYSFAARRFYFAHLFHKYNAIFPLKRGDLSEDWKQREELCIDNKHTAKPELMWSFVTSDNSNDINQGAEKK